MVLVCKYSVKIECEVFRAKFLNFLAKFLMLTIICNSMLTLRAGIIYGGGWGTKKKRAG
jgi:hypothetical protein